MKKLTTVLILSIILSSFNVSAQSNTLEFGLKAGANFAQFTPNPQFYGNELGDYKRKIGYYAGGFLNIRISEKFELQPELLLAMQGTRLVIEDVETQGEFGSSPVLFDFKSKVSDLTIILPLEIRFYFTEKYFVEAGPQLGYLVDRKYKAEGNYLSPDIPIEREDPNDPNNFDYDKFEYGLNLGTGYKLSEDLTLSARYFRGLNERDNNLKSSVFNLGLEFKL